MAPSLAGVSGRVFRPASLYAGKAGLPGCGDASLAPVTPQPRVLTAAVLLLCAGCAPTHAVIATDVPQAIPAELADAVKRSQLLGQALFQQDLISARGTDVMLEAKLLPSEEQLRGWLTVPTEEGGWRVLWISQTEQGLGLAYEVTFPPGSARESNLERFQPPKPLTAEVEAMFRAREASVRKLTGFCGTGVNPVILPAALVGKEGWLVYLLGSSNRQGDVVLAGHRLFRVSPDGTEVEAELPLSRTCLVRAMEESGGKVAGMMVSHNVTDYPLETHVFTALLYGMELYVATERGLWKVDEKGEVQFMQKP